MALDRLEVYMLAAENPVGRKQLRPIFRRKRSREVLTREQVTAIKLGRRVLRREMKAQGITKRIDFEVTATNLGLYFDRNRLLWPFFLWLIRDHTVAKLLATTALLTTVVTAMVPVVEYLTEYLTQYITIYLDKYITVKEDRFTIDLDPELFASGFQLCETSDFQDPTSQLICIPAEGIPCISIADIPKDVDTISDGEHHDTFFAYTFYCRYVSDENEPVDYRWTINLNEETKDLSVATWLMVFEDGKMNFYAENGSDGNAEMLPAAEVTDRGYQGAPLMELCDSPEEQYQLIKEGTYYDYYRVVPKSFVSDKVAVQGIQTNVMPDEPHKYTVVIWLEGDDPECTDEMIGAQIGMNFQIELLDENMEEIATQPQETESTQETPGA